MNLMRYSWKYLRGDGLRDTLHHYRGSPLTGSPNRCVCGSATLLPHPNCAFGTTSHTPKTLAEIRGLAYE